MDTFPKDEQPKVNDDKTSQRDQEKFNKVHERLLKRFHSVKTDTNDQRNRREGTEDSSFVSVRGGMWDNDDFDDSWNGMPKLEANQLGPMLNVVVGDQRESDIGVNVIPAGDGATEKIADTFKGLIRNIQNLSNFDDARDNAFLEAIKTGFGAWYITREWDISDPWVQNLVIKPIRSAINMVWFDPGSTGEVNEDADWCIVGEEMSTEEFKHRYPDAGESNFPLSEELRGLCSHWSSEGRVTVADYWEKVRETKRIGLFTRVSIDKETQEEKFEEKTWEINKETKKILDEAAGEGWELQKDREMESHKIVSYKTNGQQILEGPYDWPGMDIPVIPVYGYQSWENGARNYWGMVRFAKDAARIYNYAWSAMITTISKAPKDPWIVTNKHFENAEDQTQWEGAAQNDDVFLKVTADPDVVGGLPRRMGPPSFPAAMVNVMAEASSLLQRITGKFASSQGDNPLDQSGRAVLALQKQGDLGTFNLIDNLAKSIRRTGELEIDLIPRIIDTARQIRITDPDGGTRMIKTIGKNSTEADRKLVNTEFEDSQTGEKVLMIDLQQGRYDVVESVSIAYATRRQEFRDHLDAISAKNPALATLLADISVGSTDFPDSDKVSKRIRRMQINSGLDEPTEEEIKEREEKQSKLPPQPPSPEQVAQQESLALAVEKLELENEKQKLENEKMKQDLQSGQNSPVKQAIEEETAIAEIDNKEADTRKKDSETEKNLKEVRTPETISQ